MKDLIIPRFFPFTSSALVFTLALTKESKFHSLKFSVTHDYYFSSTTTDPLVLYSWHFCCTIHALANVRVLLTNRILRLGELAEEAEESFTIE